MTGTRGARTEPQESRTMRARIIGGGVAGLSLAIALQRRADIDGITVYERETSETLPQKLGHGLILMENGVSALEAIDAVDVLAESRALRRTVIQDRNGALLHSEAYSVTRAAIIEGLRAKLEPSTLRLVGDPSLPRGPLGRRSGAGVHRAGRPRQRPRLAPRGRRSSAGGPL